MSHGWQAPSFADVTGSPRTVRCPQCRRPVAPDMLYPTDALPAALRARWQRPDAAYACDFDHETLVREKHVSRADLARLHGAPEALALLLDAKRPSAPRPAIQAAIRDRDRRNPRG